MRTFKTSQNLAGFIVGGMLLLVIAGSFIRSASEPQPSKLQNGISSQNNEVSADPIIVTITEVGFEPAAIKVKRDESIQWVYVAGPERTVASNPYPARTDLPDLVSPDSIGEGETFTYTFQKSGTFNYHDAGNPIVGGTIIVD